MIEDVFQFKVRNTMSEILEWIMFDVEEPVDGMFIIAQSDDWIHTKQNATGTIVGRYSNGVFKNLRGEEVKGIKKWVEFDIWRQDFVEFLNKFTNG